MGELGFAETDLTFDQCVFQDGTADNKEVKSVEERHHVALQEKVCNSTRREHYRARNDHTPENNLISRFCKRLRAKVLSPRMSLRTSS